MPELDFLKLGMNIKAAEPISTAYTFLPSVCVSVCEIVISFLGSGSGEITNENEYWTSSYPSSSHLTSGDCDDFCPTICLPDSSVLVVIVN
jgi:hypothetical protein